jgi:hypothetical protein
MEIKSVSAGGSGAGIEERPRELERYRQDRQVHGGAGVSWRQSATDANKK